MAMVMENQQPLAPMPVVRATPRLPPPPPPPPPLPQVYKHCCKVCKKEFMCGRALGGHMRAHGVTDDGDSGPCGGAWDSSEAAGGTAAAATTKRMSYSLRTNAGRHKNCRLCENCGKEFTSWKSLLDHGSRCSFVDQEDDLNIAGADIDGEDDEEDDLALAAGGWSKGKRTRRTKVIVVDNGSQTDEPLPATSREEEDLANCLVILASSSRRGGVQPQAIADVHQQPYASTSNKDKRTLVAASEDEHQRFLMPPPQPMSMLPPTVPQLEFLAPPQVMPSSVVSRGVYECQACKKVFTSHQALGGHRASHKKVKGCFAAKLAESSSRNDDCPQPNAVSSNDNVVKVIVEAIPAVVDTTAESTDGVDGGGNAEEGSAPEMAITQVVDEAPSSSTATVPPFKKKGKVHECSICHRVFMSGQALGGHKRSHRLTTGDPTAAMANLVPFVTAQDHDHNLMHALWQRLTPMFGTPESCHRLDLNNVPMNQSAGRGRPAATRPAGELNQSMLSLLQPLSSTNASNMHINTAAATSGHYDDDDLPEATATEDEADSRTSAKRAKISDLKDMNMAGENSPWLQVGIALPSSETNERLLKPKG